MNPLTALRKPLWELKRTSLQFGAVARGMTSLISGSEHNNRSTLWPHNCVRVDLKQSGVCLTWTKTQTVQGCTVLLRLLKCTSAHVFPNAQDLLKSLYLSRCGILLIAQ
jgi:hypothetical protein